ncbi:hypothetical protein NP233_g8139 [Leucocoprinus birnbaumii]|uniref:Uncharacterized protein n=1 Tax=Leucocoprinus birnbaumii TaxID=56174 RepID=A0AAD5VN21_9AGAR|nr:hypothetical protein NP233_g8139 [Leucocoprinus birnbaumii]
MVQMGEQAKYLLATVEVLLEAFELDIGAGTKAQQLGYTALVGSFHGHTHNHLCQLSNHATYVEGLGLKDLEGCTFLINNYKQALGILTSEPTVMAVLKEHHIDNASIFTKWLAEECEHLQGLSKEPVKETLEMKYYHHLVNLEECWANVTDQTSNQDSAKWKNAKAMVEKKDYQQCLDKLEGLVISQVFELSKMNMSQSGYKLRNHVAKALCTQSKAMKSSLEHYNKAAENMQLLRPTLTWEEVVKMNNNSSAQETRIAQIDSDLAYQAQCYQLEQTQYGQLHVHKFKKLNTMAGFTGTLVPGIPIDKSLVLNIDVTSVLAPPDQIPDGGAPADDQQDEDNVEGAEADELQDCLETLLTVSY